MSICDLRCNPKLITELQAVFGGSGSGISTLSSPDSNLTVAVAGSDGEISLKPTLNVTTAVNVPTLTASTAINCNGEFLAAGSAGTAGQVLSSNGASSAPSWINAGGSGGGITSLSSPDNNLTVAVVGANGQVSLKSTVNVGTQINCPTINSTTSMIVAGDLVCDNTAGNASQVLVSRGVGLSPQWTDAVAGGIRQVYYATGQNVAQSGSTTAVTVPINNVTGLTAGKDMYITVSFSADVGATATAIQSALVVDSTFTANIFQFPTQGFAGVSNQYTHIYKYQATATSHNISVSSSLTVGHNIATTTDDYYMINVVQDI